MRIDRLAAENPRTQGATQRRWYRRHNPEHLRHVARLFERSLAARGPDAPTTAIVLGAGACTELPLERLAGVCSQVTLVDLDAPGMERARHELPPDLRRRVRPLVADLTGGVSRELATRLREQPWADLASLDERAPLGAAAACLDRCHVPDPPAIAGAPAGTFGLVVSSCVLTQLFSLPLLDVLDTLATAAPNIVALQAADSRYQAAARAFRRHLALAHLDLVADLLAQAGAGLIASDVAGYLLPPVGGPRAGEAPEVLPLLPAEVVDLPADLGARCTLCGPLQRWRWVVSAPTSARPGRTYDALGAVFRAGDSAGAVDPAAEV
jgi:hypothetical protein